MLLVSAGTARYLAFVQIIRCFAYGGVEGCKLGLSFLLKPTNNLRRCPPPPEVICLWCPATRNFLLKIRSAHTCTPSRLRPYEMPPAFLTLWRSIRNNDPQVEFCFKLTDNKNYEFSGLAYISVLHCLECRYPFSDQTYLLHKIVAGLITTRHDSSLRSNLGHTYKIY